MADPAITIVPEAVRVKRITVDGKDWIVTTYEFDYVGEPNEALIAVEPDQFIGFITASLSALGFGEGDLEYIVQKYGKEFR